MSDLDPAVRDLVTDPDAPYGRDENGNALTQQQWEQRYVDADGDLRYPPNQGGDRGSFVHIDNVDTFRDIFGGQFDRMGGPGGGYFSVPGTPFEARALPPGNLRAPYSVRDLTSLPDLKHCEAFLPNAEEAMRYTGTDCPRTAAHALTEFVPLAVVTLGAEGAYAVDRRTGETAEVPAIEVEALDPTGAGDVFVAGFVTGTLAGWPLADRLAFAGLTAALSVQEFGGSLSAPGWAEIAAWWRRVQSVEGQDPAALRRYAFLDDLVPEVGVEPWPRRRAVPTIGFRRTA